MTLNGWLQILLYCGIVIALVKPLGGYMTRVFNGERTILSPVFVPIERGLYALSGTSDREEQHWTTYAISRARLQFRGFLVLYALQRLQAVLPFNPAGMAAVGPELSFNTATSFVSTPTGRTMVAKARCPISCRWPG
jgi:K+-transporting ATPase ATPase A chain